MTGSVVHATTRMCLYCGHTGTVDIPADELRRWDSGNGPVLQVAMPGLTVGQLEQIRSGTHPECGAECER